MNIDFDSPEIDSMPVLPSPWPCPYVLEGKKGCVCYRGHAVHLCSQAIALVFDVISPLVILGRSMQKVLSLGFGETNSPSVSPWPSSAKHSHICLSYLPDVSVFSPPTTSPSTRHARSPPNAKASVATTKLVRLAPPPCPPKKLAHPLPCEIWHPPVQLLSMRSSVL